MKFPKDFQKTDFFNCGRPCRFWNGPSGGLKELLTFNKCERFLLVHNGSFAISDLMTHTLSLHRSELPVVASVLRGAAVIV
jgi:hypothetical protein